MRTLVIQRRKSSFAGLLKMYVYIEDHDNPTAKIAGTPCRMIGKLQNGDTEVLDIPESACRIFVAARKPFGYLSSEVLSLPEGSETIYLTGQNRFDFFTGSPFRFDHIVNEETIRHRTRNTRGGLWVVLAALIIGFIIGTLLGIAVIKKQNEPVVHTNKGLSITLPPSFTCTPVEDDDYLTTIFASGNCLITVVKESRAPTHINSLKAYASAVEQMLTEEGCRIITPARPNNGHYYIEYRVTEEGVTYRGVMFLYLNVSAHISTSYYYRVDITVPTEEYDTYREDFFEWAKTVEVE